MGARLPPVPASAAPTVSMASTVLNASSPALRLLRHEADVRRLKTEAELLFHLVNEVRGLLRYGSALLLRRQRASGRLRIELASDLPDVDRDAPLLRALEARIERLPAPSLTQPLAFEADDSLAGYPFGHLLWLPLRNPRGSSARAAPAADAADGEAGVDAGVVFARAEPFTAGEQTLLARLAETYAHAWAALPVRRAFGRGAPLNRRWAGGGAVALLALGLLPVRLSVMAPVEVVAAEPFVVTAPIAGVVRAILVAPNSAVAAGQPLLQFEDIQPRNEKVLAQQRLAVAQARDSRTGAAAFRDNTANHDMATAHAEFELARVSYDYAVEVLARTQVRAPGAGLAIYTDRRDWEGRAVQVGEEIMQVADPAKVAFRVDLSTANSIELAQGAEVGIYLDNAPLGGLKAQLRSVSYTPRSEPGGATSYTVLADPEADAAALTPPRIGARGTARLYGERVPLLFQLLRRPIAATRQFIGL